MDIVVEIVGVFGVILLVALPLYYFDKLPEIIPNHFGANGEPDGFGDKRVIWSLPIIGVVMYVGMSWLNNYPHIFNYPQQITKENAEKFYTIGTKMLRVLNTLITCVCVFMTYSIIQTALGNQNGLGFWFTLIFFALIFGVVGYYMYKLVKKK